MHPSSNPEINTGINPFPAMSQHTLIVSTSSTSCGNCGVNVCLTTGTTRCIHCGVQWLFTAANYRMTDESTIEMGLRLWESHRGFTFIGIVGGSHLADYYLVEACFISARPSWRQTLRRLWLDLLKKDETR